MAPTPATIARVASMVAFVSRGSRRCPRWCMTAHAVAIGSPERAALHVGRRVEPAEPVVEHERLVTTQLLAAVQDHRRALRRVPELVQVGRDRRDAVDPEVPRRHRLAEQLHEREDEPAHARVDVHPRARLDCASAAISGIGSMTPCGYCGAEPTTSTVFSFTAAAIASTSARQSARTGVVVHAHAEQAPPCGTPRARSRRHHLRRGDAALGRPRSRRRLHRHQDALGTARRHEPGRVVGAVNRPAHMRDDLATGSRRGSGTPSC